jgi:N-acetylmuramoyl-L-alanine amidase
MKKIILTAGHYKYTPGKSCPANLDPYETREWVLNDRICDKIEQKLKAYEGYELLRTDDTTGEKGIPNDERIAKANEFGGDIYLSIHHNAGIKGGKGGGIVAYVWSGLDKVKHKSTFEWQKELYDALIKHTGLKGNRATPLATGNYQVLRETNCDAVLLEMGFMDSATDCPIILTDKYAEQCADAITEVLVKRLGLTKKPEPVKTDKHYRVQVGYYSKKEFAEKMVADLKAAGFDAIIKEE